MWSQDADGHFYESFVFLMRVIVHVAEVKLKKIDFKRHVASFGNRMQQTVQQMQHEIIASHVTLMVLTIALL